MEASIKRPDDFYAVPERRMSLTSPPDDSPNINADDFWPPNMAPPNELLRDALEHEAVQEEATLRMRRYKDGEEAAHLSLFEAAGARFERTEIAYYKDVTTRRTFFIVRGLRERIEEIGFVDAAEDPAEPGLWRHERLVGEDYFDDNQRKARFVQKDLLSKQDPRGETVWRADDGSLPVGEDTLSEYEKMVRQATYLGTRLH